MPFWHKSFSFSPWWALPVLGAVLLLPVRSKTCACAPPPIPQVMELMIAQKHYFGKHGYFAADMHQLESDSGISLTSRPSPFQSIMEATSDRLIIYGILKQEIPSDLLGIGIWKHDSPNMIVALAKPKDKNLKEGEFIQIKCVGIHNSLTKPNPPAYDGTKFTCPDGYRNPGEFH